MNEIFKQFFYQIKSVFLKTAVLLLVCNIFMLQVIIASSPSEPQQQQQRQITVSGIVTDRDGEIIPGANVTIKGTTFGVATDENGRYSINVPDRNAVLVFTYIGYVPTEIRVSAETKVDVVLQEDSQVIEEVVVIGYGTIKRTSVTGSVGYASSKVIEDRPISNLGQGLQGAIANLNITQSNGMPGQGATFNIRGRTNIAGSGGPLILVDGIEMNPNILNPGDIKSVSVLKDAASAAIYGARAANGVVYISTRTGYVSRKPEVSFGINYSINKPTRHPEYMNSLEYANWMNAARQTQNGRDYYDAFEMQAIQNFFNNPKDNPTVVLNPNTGLYQYVANTDWYKALNKPTYPMSQYSVNIGGGTKDVKYYTSASYFNQKGISKFMDENYDRFNITSDIMYRINHWMEAGMKSMIAISDNLTGGQNNSGTNAVLTTLAGDSRPTMPVYHPDGNFAGDTGGDNGYFTNLAAWQSLGGNSRTKGNDLTLQAKFIIKPFEGFKINTEYAYRYVNSSFKNYKRSYLDFNPAGGSRWFPHTSPNQVSYSESATHYQVFNIYGEYDKKFSGGHEIKLTLGFNQEVSKYRSVSASRTNLISNEVPYISTASGDRTTGDSANEWAIRGVPMRIIYSYKDKYMLTLIGRYDGNSRFPSKDRFAFFPSVSGAWRISKENFWDGIRPVMNDFKIKGGYGTLGNASGVGTYPYIANYGTSEVNYLFAGKKEMTVTAPNLVSPTLTWETIKQFDLGVETAFIDNRLKASYEYYIKDVVDMLQAGKLLPAVLAVSEPTENAASMRTKGWELSIDWSDALDNGLNYGASFSLWDSKSWITKFDNPTNNLGSNYVGQVFGDIWGYTVEGLFKTDEEAAAWNQSAVQNISPYRAGDIKLADLNGDGVVSRGANTLDDSGDLSVIGNNFARYQFSLRLDSEWKGFDANVFFQGTGKRQVYPSSVFFYNHYTSEWAVPQKLNTDYWREDNPDAYFPRPRLNAGNTVNTAQTRFLQNAAFCRLKQLTFGYTLPFKYTDKIAISKCRVYFSANNLWELSKMTFKSFDPEQPQMNAYPFPRSFSFGANITL